MFQHLLVTTDGSDLSSAALNCAATLARQLQARITLLHVNPDPDRELDPTDGLNVDINQLRQEIDTEGHQILEAGLRELDGLQAEPRLVTAHHKDVARVIAHEARTLGADALIMGTHGRTGLAHLTMGSVAERVLHASTIPVLLIRHPGCTSVTS